MADPATWGVVALVGSAINAGVSYVQSEKQEDAANAANARAQAAADSAAAVSSAEAAAPQNTTPVAKKTVDTSAQRRASLSRTVNKYAANGLRTKLN